jgi:tripartite-type tricarboxylate transporter receptor subunit TctC
VSPAAACETTLPSANKSRQKNLFTAATPSAIINRLNAEIGKIVRSAKIQKYLENQGRGYRDRHPAVLGQKLEEDYTRAGRLLMDLKIKR